MTKMEWTTLVIGFVLGFSLLSRISRATYSMKIIARQKRFWHCLWLMFADFGKHRQVDLYYYPALPTRLLYGLRGRHDKMSCTCGKVFWEREKK